MRWLQSWFGLKIFVLCALIVLLVPTWRREAREQWQSETWKNNGFSIGGVNDEIAGTAARFPNDFAAQLEGVSRRFSTSPNAQRAPIFSEYAALSRRFPRENAIRQAWLLDVTRGPLLIETAPLAADKLPGGKFSNSQRPSWLSGAELESAIDAARQGAQIEPRNSFFPWMESALYFALKRPDDALKSLERAAKCTDFEDGTSQTVRRRLELLGRVQSVGWSDKTRVSWSILLPHFAKIHGTARAALEISRQKHARGDKIGALQIAATTARAAQTLSESRDLLITVIIGDSIQSSTWNGALKNAGRGVAAPKFPNTGTFYEPKERLPAYQAYREKLAREAANYARELGQEALAKQALSTLPNLRGQRLGALLADPDFEGDQKHVKQLSSAFWLESRLLRLSLVGAALWILAFLPVLGRPIETPGRRALAIWAAFCVGATAVLLGVGLIYFGLGTPEFFSQTSQTTDAARNYGEKLNDYLALIWFAPLLLLSLRTGFKIPLPQLEKRGFSRSRVAKIVVFGAIVGSILAVFLRGGATLDSPLGEIQIHPPIVVAFWLFVIGAWQVVASQSKKRLATLMLWSVPWFVYGTIAAHRSFFDTGWVAVLALWSLALLIISVRLAHLRPAPQLQRWFFDVTDYLRVLAATLAVAGAVFYLGTKLVALPWEMRLNASLDRQLEVGGVAFVEEELARAKNRAYKIPGF